MKSSLETVSTLERKLNIEVPATEVQAAFETAFQDIQKHVTIKGFRKGKAPLSMIRSLYRDRVQQDIAQDLIQTYYAIALREHKLEPVSYPTIEFDPVEPNEDFQFSAEFEVRPEVQIRQLEGLSVKTEKLGPSDKAVDGTLENLRKRHAETVAVLEDRPAQLGDLAVIDFKGFVDGKEIESGSAEGHVLELGSHLFIPGFEEGIVGMKPGATSTIKIDFPDNYHTADLAGKPVEFQVTLKELKMKSILEINDEFAKSLGDYENLAALKAEIKADHERRETQRIEGDLKNRLLKALVDRNPVEVPKALLAEQKKALIEDFERRMRDQGVSQEQYEKYRAQWDADFDQTASYMVQASFLVEKIAVEHNLRATPQELDAKLREYATQTGINFARMREFYEEERQAGRLAYQITEEKVLDFVRSKAAVQEVSREELADENP